MESFTEENYLKAIYHLSLLNSGMVQTNAIAEKIRTKPASVTDMMKKLADKNLVDYIKYQGVSLTEKGKSTAISIVRKHRLWELFLVQSLGFKWDEVHEIAEELEHVNSDLLIRRLDEFLGYPKRDPHGDPIPDQQGNFEESAVTKLSKLQPAQQGTIIGVTEHSPEFLKYLEKTGLTLGTVVRIEDINPFDGSIELLLEDKKLSISKEVAKNLLMKL